VAAITTASSLYLDGAGAQRTMLLRLVGVNSGDSIDVSVVGPFAFHKLQAVAFIGCDQRTAVVATFVGTVITITSAGLVTDTVNLLVVGE